MAQRDTTQQQTGAAGASQLQQSGTAALRRALAYACGYWRETFGALLALLLVSAANLAVPQLVRVAVDDLPLALFSPEHLGDAERVGRSCCARAKAGISWARLRRIRNKDVCSGGKENFE